MPEGHTFSLVERFSIIRDPRHNQGKEHLLVDLLTIALLAMLCGADSFVEMEEFGIAREPWLKKFLKLPSGIPSHDTFGRVFSLIDHTQLETCFTDWVTGVFSVLGYGGTIAIDGKTSRRSHDRGKDVPALHMVSAFSTDLGLALGQEKTAADSNEITAVPALLEKLMLKGCIVTLDAMGCQREIAAKIKERGGDYLLALKGNQGELHEAVRDHFDAAVKEEFRGFPHDFQQTVDKGHGRIETRSCWVVKDVAWLPRVRDWPSLNMLGMVEAKREIGERTTVERRYYIGTIGENAKLFAKTVRDHRAIENSLHWVLDVAFREDESRIRLKNAAANMAVLRHMTLNVLRSEKGSKRGIKVKRSKAGRDESYLLKLIGLTGL